MTAPNLAPIQKRLPMIRFRPVSGFLFLLWALALHLWPATVAPTRAQGSRKDDIVFNSRGVPLAGATIRVCAMPATGQPCSPLAQIYSDIALTQAISNPTTTDGMGNYTFYAAPGRYEIEISGPSITTKQVPNVILPSDPASPTFSSISSTGGISAFSLSLTGNLTVNGSTLVSGNLASGTLNLSNQGTPPGAAGTGTVNLYTKTADKRLYYKDDTGTEIGPLSTASGAQTNVSNTFTAPQNIAADFHTKGPNPVYDLSLFGAYIGPNYATGTTGNITSGQATLTLASALDFQNTQGVLVLGAGPATTLAAPSGLTAAAVGATGSSTYVYCVVDEDFANGRTPCSATATVTNAVSALGLQTVALSACNRASGVVTCTTSAAHNIISGTQIEIPRFSTADQSFEGAFTTTSASGTTFTYNQYGVADKSGSVTSGNVRAGGRVALKWTYPAAGTYVMKHFVYRCNTTCALPANAANFALVGVAIGDDSYFVDYGYGLTTSNVDNGDVPATAPTSASAQWLPTTITNGGGTTALTLAATASSTVSAAKVLHDNTPVLNVACAAIAATHTGGTILIPSLGGATQYFFPIASNFGTCASQAEIDFGSPVWATGSIIPQATMLYKGIAGGNNGQLPAFYYMNPVVLFNGYAYPFFFFKVLTSSNSALQGVLMQCNQNYQSCIVQDEVIDSSAVTSIRYDDVFPASGAHSTAYVARGGFGFFWNRGGWASNPGDFSAPPAALFTGNCGSGASSSQLPAIVYTEKTYLFGGMVWDSCGVALGGSLGGNHMEFREMLAENGYGPVLRANVPSVRLYAIDFLNVSYSDFLGGYATPLFDLTNTATGGMRFIHSACATGFQPTVETSASTTAYSGIEINNAFSGGCTYTGTNNYLLRTGIPAIDTYGNEQIAFTGSSARSYYLMSLPGPAQSAVVSSGGSVSVGAHTYTVTAVDFDGGETTTSTSISATTTSGSQTITVTLPATFPAGAAGVNLYRDGGLANAGGCNPPQFTTPGGTFVDTFSFTCGNSAPSLNTAGITVLSGSELAAPKIRINTEAVSAAPRSEQTVFLPGALTSTWTGGTWTLDKAITVTRVQVQAKTAPSGCSTNAIVRVTDGTTPINVTLSSAANDSGSVSQNYAAGASVSSSVQTAAAGCTTSPADANIIIQYKMQ